MTLMDEALAFAMVANEIERQGVFVKPTWKRAIAEGRPLAEILDGLMVTARLDMKFLKPVICPGVVGVEVVVLENMGHKMKLRGVMKDGNGTPLVQADGVWVRIGKIAKL
jgi:acyl-CoA thioesterase FadM